MAGRTLRRASGPFRRVAVWDRSSYFPVYVRVPGQELFSASAAAYMLTLIDGAQIWAATLATRPDTERLTRVLRVFADARDHLHRRLHEHGVRH